VIRPGPHLAGLVAVAAATACLAAWHWYLLGVSLGILALLGAAALRERWTLLECVFEARYPARATCSLGEAETLEVSILQVRGATVRALVRLRYPELLGFGDSVQRFTTVPGDAKQLRFTVTGQSRGEEALEAPVMAFSRWGLVERIERLAASCVVAVLPDLRAVSRLRSRLDALFLHGHGARLAPRVGQGREFDRLRDYVNGDDFRNIAWKSSARRGHLIVQEYRVERSQDILFCVDRGHRMSGAITGASPPLTRLDHALNAAVLGSYLCNRSEDRVGMLSFAAQVDTGILQGRGTRQLSAITAFATGVASTWLQSDYRALAGHLRRRLRGRTLVMLLTCLPERGNHGDLVMAVRMLVPRHLPLVLALDDPQLEAEAQAEPEDHVGLCRRIAAADIVDDRVQLTRELRQLGALVVHTTPRDAGEAAVNAYLDVKRRQLL